MTTRALQERPARGGGALLPWPQRGPERKGGTTGQKWSTATEIRGPVAATSLDPCRGWRRRWLDDGGICGEAGGSAGGGAGGHAWLRCGLGRRRLGLETLTAPLICSRLGLWLGRATAQPAGPLAGPGTAQAAGPGDRTGCWSRRQGRPVGPAAHQNGHQAPLARRARTGQMDQAAAPACRQRRGPWQCKPSGPDHEAMHPGPVALFLLLISFRNFQQYILQSIDISLC
jgi:hypothetical protein